MESAQIGAREVIAGRVPLFCDTALARRIERVEAQFVARSSEAARRRAGTAGFVIPLAGGVASFAGEGSPFNKVAGLGFGGVPGAAALGEVERAFAACGAPVQAELAKVDAGESDADRWQLEQRIKHAENQLVVSDGTTSPPIHVSAPIPG